MTDKMWNLTADQWSSVLGSDVNATEVGSKLRRSGAFVPWSQVMQTADCVSTADLGCGRGEHSAVLARAGRQTTLVDWSHENLEYCERLYSRPPGQFRQADITRPLPFETIPSMRCSAAVSSSNSMRRRSTPSWRRPFVLPASA